MSVELYKSQATRLSAYLADKHNVKLKHSYLLEAVAQMHGKADWNTLVGTDKPTLLDRVRPKPVVSSSWTLDDMRFLSATQLTDQTLRLGVTGEGERSHSVGYQVLRRHLLYVGGQGVGWSSARLSLIAQHVINGGGVLVLDTFCDSTKLGMLSDVLEKAGGSKLQVVAPAEIGTVDFGAVPSQAGAVYMSSDASASDATAAGQMRAAIERVVDAMHARFSSEVEHPLGQKRPPPLMVVLNDASWYLKESDSLLFAQARGMGVMFVVQVDSLSELKLAGETVYQVLMENTFTKVFFEPNGSDARAAATDFFILQTRSGARRWFATDWWKELSELRMRQAYCLSGNEAVKLNTCSVVHG